MENKISEKDYAPLSSEEQTEKSNPEVAVAEDEPLDKTIKLMSPARMVLRRFFRSKLSVVLDSG